MEWPGAHLCLLGLVMGFVDPLGDLTRLLLCFLAVTTALVRVHWSWPVLGSFQCALRGEHWLKAEARRRRRDITRAHVCTRSTSLLACNNYLLSIQHCCGTFLLGVRVTNA